MPKLFSIGRYVIFFWSNEDNEPIHVHVSVKRASSDSMKVWLSEDGGCVIAKNKEIVHRSHLNEVMSIISNNHDDICDSWKKFFDTEEIKFYC